MQMWASHHQKKYCLSDFLQVGGIFLTFLLLLNHQMKMQHKDVNYLQLSDLFIFDVHANVYFITFLYTKQAFENQGTNYSHQLIYMLMFIFITFITHPKSQQVSSIFLRNFYCVQKFYVQITKIGRTLGAQATNYLLL